MTIFQSKCPDAFNWHYKPSRRPTKDKIMEASNSFASNQQGVGEGPRALLSPQQNAYHPQKLTPRVIGFQPQDMSVAFKLVDRRVMSWCPN